MFRLSTTALLALSIIFMTFQPANAQESILDLLNLEDPIMEEGGVEGEGEPIEELSAKERFNLSVEYASKGKLLEANEEIGLALLMEPQNPAVRNVQRILTDVEEQTITREIAVYLFKGMHFGRKRLFVFRHCE